MALSLHLVCAHIRKQLAPPMRTFAPLAIAHLARSWGRALILIPDHSTSPPRLAQVKSNPNAAACDGGEARSKQKFAPAGAPPAAAEAVCGVLTVPLGYATRMGRPADGLPC